MAAPQSTLRAIEELLGSTPRPPVRTIAAGDTMWEGKRDHYFEIGRDALACVRRAQLAIEAGPPRRILDLPCGFGRVLRYLKAAWPDAELTACDLDREGVDFCAETFGARPVYAQLDVDAIDLGDESFDLIWVGSLFSHLDAPMWEAYLRLFHRSVRVGGLLVLTTLGRYPAHRIRHGDRYRLDPADVPRLLESFDQTGFGYVPYPNHEHYGIALASPAWVMRGIEQRRDLRLVEFAERGWADHLDVIACERLV